jgi:hypothetical protein
MRLLLPTALALSLSLRLCDGFSVSSPSSSSASSSQQSLNLGSSTTRLGAATALSLDVVPPVTPEANDEKIGVLLLNLGGPETGEDVEGALIVSSRLLSIRNKLLRLMQAESFS